MSADEMVVVVLISKVSSNKTKKKVIENARRFRIK